MKIPIGFKLGVGFLLSLLIMIGLLVYGLSVSETALKETVGKQSVFLADNMLREVNSNIFNILDELRVEAEQPYIRKLLNRAAQQQQPSGTGPQGDAWQNSISRRLHSRFIDYYEHNKGYSVFEQLFLVNIDRQLVAAAGKSMHHFHIEEQLWNDIRRYGFHIRQVILQKDTGLWVIPIAVRINDENGELIGALKATLKASTFFRTLSISNKRYRTTRIHILTRKGQRLFSTQAFRLFEDVSAQPFFKAIEKNDGFFISQKGGKDRLFAYARPKPQKSFEGFQWILLVETDREEILQPITKLRNQLLLAFGILILLMLLIAAFITRSITRPILLLQNGTRVISEGNLEHVIQQSSRDEIGDLCTAFNRMTATLRETNRNLTENQQAVELENWLNAGLSNLNQKMQGNQDPVSLAGEIIGFLADYVAAETGATYLLNSNGELELFGSYAFDNSDQGHLRLKPGEGFIGQAFLNEQASHLVDVPESFFAIDVGAFKLVPRNFLAMPFRYGDELLGVIFLGRLEPFSEDQQLFLDRILPAVAVAVHSAKARQKTAELLVETRHQSEQLQSQQEELRASNEELEEQTKALQASESRLLDQQEELQQINEELETQQEELRQSNEELEEKTEALERQQREVKRSNQDLKDTREQLLDKARDLELSNQYKSEFLANMSHELRTPLNSLLIFAQMLQENKEGNLNEKQVDFAESIHSSGAELLALINDILDLAKIESGKTETIVEAFDISDIPNYLQTNFEPLARKKGLELKLQVDQELPETLYTDRQKLFQVLKNLVANAFKFTEKGSVTVRLFKPVEKPLQLLELPDIDLLGISVSDTGIGVPKEKQRVIFEAFQQADGATNRAYGGTGLGLSICRELMRLLQGGIILESEEGVGSNFTILLPLHLETDRPGDLPEKSLDIINIETEKQRVEKPETHLGSQPEAEEIKEAVVIPVRDDREDLVPEDRVILVVDDDQRFARTLSDLAHEKSFKCLLAHDGATGLELARKYLPSAIILDINLPGMDGWTVMERLKSDPDTRPIPVHFISVLDKKMVGLKMGAIGFLTKPVSLDSIRQAFDRIETRIQKKVRRLLIVEDNENARQSLSELLSDKKGLEVHFAENARQALDILQTTSIDVMTLDLHLPDISGFELLERLEKEYAGAVPPVIVYTGREISQKEEARLRRHAESIILKGVNSADRLLDEVSLFLHRVEASVPAETMNSFRMIHDQESIFRDRQILLVDDDMRNVYALLAVLEEKGMKVQVAADGQQALDAMEQNSEIDLVLMDIMMPVMDGYEAIRRIRKQQKWQKLPIIALTAKAMKGDREKCIEAGANDYLAKPVEIEKLYSLLRVWLYN